MKTKTPAPSHWRALQVLDGSTLILGIFYPEDTARFRLKGFLVMALGVPQRAHPLGSCNLAGLCAELRVLNGSLITVAGLG